jgi:hypothetical protein
VSAAAKHAVQKKKNKDGTVSTVDKSGLTKRVIDYIFFQRGAFTVTHTLEVPSMETLRPKGMVIPSRWYPSDHFAIAARLRVNSNWKKAM